MRKLKRPNRFPLVCGLIAVGGFALAAVMLAMYFTSEDRTRFDTAGCELVSGEVLSKGQALRQSRGMQFPVYLVRYSFQWEGVAHTGRGRVGREWYHWLEVGAKVEIYVDADKPSRHFLALEHNHRVGRLLRTALVSGLIGAGSLLVIVFRGIVRRKKIVYI